MSLQQPDTPDSSPEEVNLSYAKPNEDHIGYVIREAESQPKNEDDKSNAQVHGNVDKINATAEVEDGEEVDAPKLSKELKSILALSKEAKLDTNIAHKRKSVEPGAKAAAIVKRRSSTGSNTERSRPEKKLKAQDWGVLKKRAKSVSAGNSRHEDDASDDEETKEKEGGSKAKRKRESLPDLNTGGASEEYGKRSRKSLNNITMNSKQKDSFCWRCHHVGATMSCETCPRSFHQRCLKQNITQPNRWLCPECVTILKAENLKQRSPAMREMTLEHLCGLLKFALKRMMQVIGCEPFIHPVSENEFPEYKSYVVQPMDLTCLEKNIKDNLYGSTQAFEADAKWILHNSIIFNSYQSKLTTIAKSMIKICKQEMAEIENCASCYLNANTRKKTWFVEVCPKPHLLVWAKLKGFPYWPAKAMRSNSLGMVDVRFFGAHDRAWVPFKEIFLFSLKDPNSNRQKRNDINESLKELRVHIENLKKVHGEFHYSAYRIVYDPERELKQLQAMLPCYDPDAKIKPRFKRASSKPRTNGSSSPTDIDSSSEKAHSDTETKELSNQMGVDDLEKSGFGTEDEDADFINESDGRSDKSSNFKSNLEGSLSRSSGDLHSSIGEAVSAVEESNLYLSNRVVRGGVRMRGGYTNTSGKIKIIPKLIIPETESRKRLSGDELELPNKFPRHKSDQSIRSDSSLLSNISDKINKVDISENMEITLRDDLSGTLSISENISPDESSKIDLPELIDNKRKPIVQVNLGADENTEFTISPPNKSRIADRLMRKLSEPEEQPVEKATEASTSDLGEKFCDLNQTATETDLLLEKFKHKDLTVLEEITELSADTEIFETKDDSDKTQTDPVKSKDSENIEVIPEDSVGKSQVDCNETPVDPEKTQANPEKDFDQKDETNADTASTSKTDSDDTNTTSSTLNLGTSSDLNASKDLMKDSTELTRQEIKNIILSSANTESPIKVTIRNREPSIDSLLVSSSDEEPPQGSKLSSKAASSNFSDKSSNSQQTEPETAKETKSGENILKEKEATVSSTSEDEGSGRCLQSDDKKKDSLCKETKENSNIMAKEVNNVATTEKTIEAPLHDGKDNKTEEKVQTEISRPESANTQEQKKRKRSTDSDKNDEVEEVNPLQKKLMRVVNIEEIKKKNLETSPTNNVTKERTPPLPEPASETTEQNQELSNPDSITIKSEPTSEDERSNDEPGDDEYKELKLKYLSALNISEKMPPEKPKQVEIRTRSKTEGKCRALDNLAKVIDQVASRYSIDHENEEITLSRVPKRKEIFIKPLSKMQIPKQRARKSFPVPMIKTVYPPQKKELPKITTKSFANTVATSTPIKSSTVVTKPTETPSSSGNILFLAQTSPMSNNITILPPNQPITYSANMGNPILTMVQHPVLAQSPATSSTPITTSPDNESQNYIPQSGASSKTSTITTTKSPMVTDATRSTTVGMPALAPISSTTVATNANTSDPAPRRSDILEEIQNLSAYVPETLTKALSDIMCRVPPRLKPRPPGPLSTHFDEGLPSVAGDVTTKINSISHRLSDYFRGMLIELLQEMNGPENPEVEIARLRLENEELKHKHAEELLEVKRNISTILKDIQKCMEDERNCIVEETRSACELECVKRVEEAKSKQWCANCSKEAQFYCCWNTSYCDYPCQQKHWAKHMSKCTQNIQNTQQMQSTSTSGGSKQQPQPLVLRPTTAPKGFTKALIGKPTKVFVNRTGSNKGSFNIVRTSGSHITLVESTPGNYELVGNGGPISVGGKVITNIGKIKCGNVISVTSPSTASTAVTGSGQKAIVIAQSKPSANSIVKPAAAAAATSATVISDDECE